MATIRRPLTVLGVATLTVLTACQDSTTTDDTGLPGVPGVTTTSVETTTTTAGDTTVPATDPATTDAPETTAPPTDPPVTDPPPTDPPPTDPPPTDPPPTDPPPTDPPPPAPCGTFPAIPGGAAEVNTATIDAVGDGSADDTVTSYFDPGAGVWRMRLDLSSGTTSEIDVPGVGAGVARVLGGVQVDGGGAQEFLAVVGAGAATSNVGAFGADGSGCLFQFTEGGGAFIAPVGATVTRRDGLACTAGGLSRDQAEDTGGGSWNVIDQTIGRVAPTELAVTASSIVGGLAEADVGDIAVLDCPGLSL